ncbi:MAG: START domain-containing protein [Myxococcaceae bacterium]|nr:START domain-containing protein [Myxococcaceae bacterium]
MSMALVVPLMTALASTPGAEPPWNQVAQADGITVLSRTRPGSPVGEMKATGLIDAPPEAVWKALWDHDNYVRTMPYTQESRVLAREQEGRVVYFYSVISPPLVSWRDFVLRVEDESPRSEGQGVLRLRWTAVHGKLPERSGIVRVRVNDGSWVLEPRDGGKRTFATYLVHMDPGGTLPKFVVNHANSTAVPDIFRAIRRVVARR